MIYFTGKEDASTLRAEAQGIVNDFLRTVAQAEDSSLLLDYDGTVAPFRKERETAFPYEGVVPLLQKIVDQGRTRVVIVSGREANEVVRFLGIEPAPEVWGLYGAQRLRANGSNETLTVDASAAESLAAAGRWLNDRGVGCAAEMKPGSIAVHWRGLEDAEAEKIRSRVLMGWTLIAERANLSLLEFDGGVEIRATDFDKGDTVQVLLNEMPVGTPVAYLGDDATDEPAFRALGDRGLSALVRSRWRPTEAKLWLKPPTELLEFLEQWLATCAGEVAKVWLDEK